MNYSTARFSRGFSRQRLTIMAAASGGATRRKRPWRKLREAKGPEEPLRTVRASPLSYITGHVAIEAEATQARDKGCVKEQPQRDEPVAMDTERKETITRDGDGRRDSKDSDKKAEQKGGGDKGGDGTCKSSRFLEIDGSIMEGGGQILRNATALSCLLHRPIHITRIRAGRTKPGLSPQHLTGIQLLAQLCGGQLEGDGLRSSEVTFDPGELKGGNHTADTHTAGSIVLLLQSTLPCLLFSPGDNTLTLRGGTNADMAPPIDYFMKVFTPIVKKFGIDYQLSCIKKGFFPRGGGEVKITVPHITSLSPVTLLERGEVTNVIIETFTAGVVRPKVGHQIADAAKRFLTKNLPSVPVAVQTVHLTDREAFGNSSGIMIVATTSTGCVFGGSANGRQKEAPDLTGRKAAEELFRNIEHGGCVDEYLQDQLIVFMALSKGESKIKTGPITLHTETAIHITELMTEARFSITQSDDTANCNIVTCTGIGFER